MKTLEERIEAFNRADGVEGGIIQLACDLIAERSARPPVAGEVKEIVAGVDELHAIHVRARRNEPRNPPPDACVAWDKWQKLRAVLLGKECPK